MTNFSKMALNHEGRQYTCASDIARRSYILGLEAAKGAADKVELVIAPETEERMGIGDWVGHERQAWEAGNTWTSRAISKAIQSAIEEARK